MYRNLRGLVLLNEPLKVLKGLTSMCGNIYGWLQIFFSCMIVFIKVFAPPLPWGEMQGEAHGNLLKMLLPHST